MTYMDEFVDQLLTEERVCDIILPRLPKREVVEDAGEIGPRKSRLLDAMEGADEEKSRSEAGSSDEDARSGPIGDDRGGSRSRSSSLSSDKSSIVRFRSRSRSISPDRMDVIDS